MEYNEIFITIKKDDAETIKHYTELLMILKYSCIIYDFDIVDNEEKGVKSFKIKYGGKQWK